MAILSIREYSHLAEDHRGNVVPVGMEPAVAGQSVTFTTTTQSAAFNASTRFVQLEVDANAYLDFGTNPTAVAGDGFKLPAGVVVFVGVRPGDKIAAVTV